MSKKTVLIVNGALGGREGNTEQLLQAAESELQKRCAVSWLRLSEERGFERRKAALLKADGIVLGTGTYWESWSSELQSFLEQMTETEGSELWLGKPVAVFVTMHSLGGKGVLSRLQGTLNLFGATLPPMSGFVYSAISHEVLREREAETEVWRLQDLEIVCHNLCEAIDGTRSWRSWEVDSSEFESRWLSPIPRSL